MIRLLKRPLLVFAVLVLILIELPPADAYTLQGRHLLRLMIQNIGRAHRLEAVHSIQLAREVQGTGISDLREIVRYDFPTAFRSDVMAGRDMLRIHLVARGKTLTVAGERVYPGFENRLDLYKDLLLYRSRDALENRLAALGVDVAVSSHGRWNGRPVFIVGARYPDETVPQVWLDKLSFRPVRWIISGKNEPTVEDSFEVWYLNWRQAGKIWYPMRIEFFQNKIKIREVEVSDVRVNPPFSKALFRSEDLLSLYPPGKPPVLDWGESSSLNETPEPFEEIRNLHE